MSLENPPDIPYELVKELADLLQSALDGHCAPPWEAEADLAIEDFKNAQALNEDQGVGADEGGIDEVKACLAEQRSEAERLQRLLAGVRRRRDGLIQELGCAGLSERAIAPIAGISNVAVHNILSSEATDV